MNGISFIIPNWNGAEKLRTTLPALMKVLTAVQYPWEIIVVDDASTDGSVALLSSNPQIRLFVNSINRGFSATANRGVFNASYDVVFIMSNDIILDASINALFHHFSDPATFAVSPKVCWKQSGSYAYGRRGVEWNKGCFKVVEYPESIQSSYTLFACGGSAAYSRDIFIELGGFDALYHPFYWEEIDLSYRAWKRGFVVIHEPRCTVYNDRGGVIKEKFRSWYIKQISGRNSYLFVWKNITCSNMLKQHLATLFPLLLHDLLRGQTRFPLCFMRAVSKLFPTVLRRYTEQREELISDEAVLSLINGEQFVGAEQKDLNAKLAGELL